MNLHVIFTLDLIDSSYAQDRIPSGLDAFGWAAQAAAGTFHGEDNDRGCVVLEILGPLAYQSGNCPESGRLKALAWLLGSGALVWLQVT